MTLLPRPALLVSLALGLASLSLASSAHAGSECTADADCGAGFYCELVPSPSVGCANDGSTCDAPAPAPATSGYCREKPLSCETDAQCPAYLSCTSSGGGTVSVDCDRPACPEGEECPPPADCEAPAEPEPGPKVCAPKLIECTADSACPTGFACNLTIGGGCTDVACAPGQDCPSEPVCEPEKKACGPKQIDCQTDAQCPTDWRCLSFTEGGCSGSGGSEVPPSSGSGGDEPVPAPAPTPGSKTLDEGGECTTTTRSLCVPKGYLAGLESGGSQVDDVASAPGGSGAPEYANGDAKGTSAPSYSAPQGSPANGGSASDGDGGCSSSGRGAGSGLLGALLVGLASMAARRRR